MGVVIKVSLCVGFFFLTLLFIVGTRGAVGGVQLASHSVLCCERFQSGGSERAGWAGTERCTRSSDDVITSVLQLVRLLALSLVMEVGVLRIA